MPKLLFKEREHPELTYNDVFLVPNNPIIDQLYDVATEAEVDRLASLHKESSETGKDSRYYIKHNNGQADVQLQLKALGAHRTFRQFALELAEKYPQLSQSISRDEVDFHPVDGFGNAPIVVANMNNVTGKRMAEATAIMGASAAVPQDKENEEMADIAAYLHSRDVRYITPVFVSSDTKVRELRTFMEKRDLETAVVTDNGKEDGKFIGLIKLAYSEKESGSPGVVPYKINDDVPIGTYVRYDNLITLEEGVSPDEVIYAMEQKLTHFIPIVCKEGRVKGVMTKKSAVAQWRYKPHQDEEAGGLAMLATVGALNKNPIDRVKYLLDLNVKGIIFDTAHFDQGVVPYRNVEAARTIIEQSARRKILLVAGNVVTPTAVRDIYAAGADVAKVGVGPGAMCETRMETGVGRPQMSAVLKTARAAKEMGKHVWADGGIQNPRDVALALAAGASQVMIGSMFTSTYESPGTMKEEGEKVFKLNSGMASRQASVLRSVHKLERDMRTIFRETMRHRSEGTSDAKIFQREGLESVTDMIHWIIDGVTSSMSYAGARNLDEFSRFAQIGVQTLSGYNEGQSKSRM